MSDSKRASSKKQRLLEKLKAKKRTKRRKLPDIHKVLAKIDKLIDVFEYEEAVEWVRKGLKMSPNNMELLEKGGMVTLEVGLTDEAYTISAKREKDGGWYSGWERVIETGYFCQAVNISPDKGSSKYLYLGQLCNGKEAVDYLLKGIELLTIEGKTTDASMDTSSAYCSLAEIYLTDECFNESADSECYKYCQKAVSCCPTNPEAYQVMASYLLSKDKSEEACSILLKGVNLWLQSNNEGSDGSGDQGEGISDPGERISDLKDTISDNKGEGISDPGEGISDPGEGISDNNEEGSCDGNNQVVLTPEYSSRMNCAKLLLEVGQYKKADLILCGLIREDNEVLAVWYLLGWCHHLSGDHTTAKTCLDRVMELNSKYDCDEEEMITHCQQLLGEIEEKATAE